MENLPQEQHNSLSETNQENSLENIKTHEIKVLAAHVYDVNSLREFPLTGEEMQDWAIMIKKVIPDVNPIEIEDAIVDLAGGKHEYNRSDGVKSIINAIQENRGNNWYYKP